MQQHMLIVNADDYGLTPGVSAGIRRAALEGIVTSTTAMMNQAAVAAELPIALETCPTLGMGVHLTLTAGKPLLPVRQVHTLVDENGCFFHRDTFIAHLAQFDPDEALAEWTKQVEKFIQITGKRPDHLDSHHHSSYFTPALFDHLVSLANEYCCAIRYPYNDAVSSAEFLCGETPEQDFLAVKTSTQLFQFCRPDHFCSGFYNETATFHDLERIIMNISNSLSKSWEIMCHPGEIDELLIALSSYNTPRVQELQTLIEVRHQDLLSKMNIRPISFSELISS